MNARAPRTGLRITTILVTMVVGTVAIILLCCILLFLDRYRSAMVQSARTSSSQAVSQVSNTVGSYLRDMGQAMELVEQSVSESGESRDWLLAAFLKYRPDVVAVTSYSAGGELLDCWSPGREPRENIFQNLSFDLSAARESEGAYMTAPHVETIFEGYYPWVVTMTAPLEGGGEAAWVSLDISFSSISSYLKNVSIGQRGYCFLMDREGNIVYHPQQQLLYAGLKSEDTEALAALEDGDYADDTVIYCLASVEGSDWRAVGVSYVDELVNRNVNDMIRLSCLLAVVVLGAALLTSWLLFRFLGRPLRGLASAMESFESDADHFAYKPVGGTREVQELSDSFEHMVLRIQELMTTVREEEINLRKTELKALQAQINPHFLYNTLDSIAWMCEQGRNADAVRMVHALARLFRISISRGHELIPIAKEIEHAESYLQIQMYRYKNQFTYDFDVDPDCLGYYCNKITLQPIIENSINHGLDLMVDEGRIDVLVRQDGDDIVFSVRDNGVGMSEEQIEAIMQHGPTDRTGIGIKNVNDRLKIYFGKSYGLHITSEPDVGTCVEIRMPKIKEGDHETK
ncbi:MAG TPA: sensor histidine kinase [Candidatus Scatomorpha intestinigallinarum]|uniref:histidine kinase n=1 Tax=Candidatus Scatomorpha intestinigallinarum TaxID=2840923 RepID=A0A9D1DM77_9FIRM|nr:sensor histidine kinase [Candidatus Scatomorpha intestinigallinarum]